VVVVVEGEKAAQALLDARLCAVGTVTGASAVTNPSALRVLADRRVVLWPDTDEQGRKHMEQIAERLHPIAAEVLLTFGHELPQRPPSWFRKQRRQQSLRDAIDRVRFGHLRRRLFRRLCAPSVLRIADTEEREAEAEILWEKTKLLAQLLVSQVRDGCD
jgi:DNA primase